MADLDFLIRTNDTDADIQSTLKDVNGNVVNLTGCTVRFRMRSAAGPATPLKVDASATIDAPATAGNVRYVWQTGNTDTPGLYLAEWRVTFPDSSVESFPNAGVLYILISEGLTGNDQVYCSLAELKALLKIKGSDHDAAMMNAVSAASRSIDNRLGRRFYPDATSTVVRKFTPVSPLYCKIDDLIGITSLVDDSGTWTLDTDFVLEPANAELAGRPYDLIRAVNAAGWASGSPEFWQETSRPTRAFTRGRRITVTGRWGWLTPPAEVRQAAMILAGQLFLRPQQAVFGVVGLGFEGEGARLPGFDPHIERLLSPYARSNMIE